MARVEHGTAGHFCASHHCCFRRHTSVNGYRISTVGCYHPGGKWHEAPETVGPYRLYETMVFKLGADGECDYSQVDFDAYNDEDAAQSGHESMVAKYEADHA
jgi:hypothetical protein